MICSRHSSVDVNLKQWEHKNSSLYVLTHFAKEHNGLCYNSAKHDLKHKQEILIIPNPKFTIDIAGKGISISTPKIEQVIYPLNISHLF